MTLKLPGAEYFSFLLLHGLDLLGPPLTVLGPCVGYPKLRTVSWSLLGPTWSMSAVLGLPNVATLNTIPHVLVTPTIKLF